MDNPRPEKVAVVTEVRERLSSSSAAVLTEYRGLDVAALAELRRALREAGGEYKVYKNTLVRFAVRDLGIEGVEALLTGPTAIAFVDGDAAAVAKALREFARTHPALVLKGAVLGNRAVDAAGVTALADLPSREVLLARVAGMFAAPMTQFAGLLAALPRNFAYGLQALIDAGGAAPAAAGGDTAPEAPEAPAAAAEAPSEEAAAPGGADPDATPGADAPGSKED